MANNYQSKKLNPGKKLDAKELKEQTTEPMHVILLDYLLRDEEKHDTILGDLEKFKTHMSKLS